MRVSYGIMVVIILALLLAMSSLFVVNQWQEAIILRLGKIKQTSDGSALIYKAGLHVKLPFVETVKVFDMRLRTLNIDASRIMTKEQKEVVVDAFVKWRIVNPVQYYKSTNNNVLQAQQLLRQQINARMRAQFGRETITDLLSAQRLTVMEDILKAAQRATVALGIKVIDVRLKRIDLPTAVTEQVYSRMRSARQKIASRIRANGLKAAEIIRAKANASVTITLAKARSESAKIRALGDAAAAQIYLDTYRKNPDFYAFYRSLEAYHAVFAHQKAMVVMGPTSRFFNYFNQLPAGSST